MLLRNLKKVANDCCFNPNKPTKDERILLDVGNPVYWTVKAMENIRKLQELSEGSVAYNACIQEATKLLILTRAFIDDKANKKPTKTRKRTAGPDNKTAETA
jgi:hypothetical protein